MKNFIVYNSTGQILRTGTCPDSMISSQAESEEFVMEGVANDIEDYIYNGQIERKPKEELDQIKEKRVIQEKRNEEEGLIRNRMDQILRDQAIAELKKEGKL